MITQELRYSRYDLIPHWLIWGILAMLLIMYNIICFFWGEHVRIETDLDGSDLLTIKSLLYAFSIILFPIIKLLRHILLTLNQTMPLNGESSARRRYFFTVTVTLLLIQSVGLFGFTMFILGDSLSTLYIFSILAALGLFLHKPDLDEYLRVCEALRKKID
jgi:hypothetical protein